MSKLAIEILEERRDELEARINSAAEQRVNLRDVLPVEETDLLINTTFPDRVRLTEVKNLIDKFSEKPGGKKQTVAFE